MYTSIRFFSFPRHLHLDPVRNEERFGFATMCGFFLLLVSVQTTFRPDISLR